MSTTLVFAIVGAWIALSLLPEPRRPTSDRYRDGNLPRRL